MKKNNCIPVRNTATRNFLFIKIGMILLLEGFVSASSAQNLLKNPGFEDFSNKRGFIDWKYDRKKKDHYFCDAEVKHSGKYSLRIEKGIAFRQYDRKVEDFQKDIIVRGWVKYENLDNTLKDGKFNRLPILGIWTYTKDYRNGAIFNLLPVAPGSKDWFFFEKRLTAEEFHRKIDRQKQSRKPVFWNFRINMNSPQPGKIWFDDLELIEVEPPALQVRMNSQAFTDEIKLLNVNIKSTVEGTVLLQDKNQKTLQSRILKKGDQQIEFDLGLLPPGRYAVLVKPENGEKEQTLFFSKERSMFSEEN